MYYRASLRLIKPSFQAMSSLRLIISTFAIIATCKASGIGHLLPAVQSVPVVRYAPFYNIPNGVRSIHAVAPPLLPAPAPLLPAPAPLLPAPAPLLPAPAPFLPAPAPFLPAPAPFLPAPAPFLPGPAPFLPAPAPFLPAPAPLLPAPAPVWPGPIVARAPIFAPALPRLQPSIPALPRIVPSIPALPAAPVFARTAVHAPFSPIIRPAAVISAHTEILPSASIPVARAYPYPVNAAAFQAPVLPAPYLKQAAWK